MEPDYIPYSKDSSPSFDIAFGLKVDKLDPSYGYMSVKLVQ